MTDTTAKRGRKPRAAAEPIDQTPMDTPEAVEAVTVLQADAATHALAVAEQTGYEVGTYSRENAVIRLRGFMYSASEAMLAIGRELIWIREHEGTDDFKSICAAAGMELRTAQRFMQAARKFVIGRTDDQADRLVQTSKSKLLELIALDDEDVAALADGETVAGLTLDEIDGMSTTELRAALREEKRQRANDKETSQRLLLGKNDKLDKLETEMDRIINGSEHEKAKAAAERETAAVQAMADAALEMLGQIQKFDRAIGAVLAIGTTSATEHAEQTLAFAFQRIAQISTERGMPVDFAAIVTPEWAGDKLEAA